MNKSKVNNSKNHIKKVFLKTQLLQFLLTLFLIVSVSTVIYHSDNLPLNSYFYIITAALAVSDFISGFYCGIKIRKNGMLNALLFCLPVNLVYFLASVIINTFKIDLTMLFSSIIIIVSSMLGGIFSVNYKSKIKR